MTCKLRIPELLLLAAIFAGLSTTALAQKSGQPLPAVKRDRLSMTSHASRRCLEAVSVNGHHPSGFSQCPREIKLSGLSFHSVRAHMEPEAANWNSVPINLNGNTPDLIAREGDNVHFIFDHVLNSAVRPASLALPAPQDSFGYTSCDLNGDGFSDLALSGSNKIRMYLSNGDQTFQAFNLPSPQVDSGFNIEDVDAEQIACLKANGNDDMDIAVTFRPANQLFLGTQSVAIAENNSDGTSWASWTYDGDPLGQLTGVVGRPTSISVGDANLDGYQELVHSYLHGLVGFVPVVVASKGSANDIPLFVTGDYLLAGASSATGYPLKTVLGDLNGDQKPDQLISLLGSDLIIRENDSGALNVSFEDGVADFQTLPVGLAADITLGDIDNDSDLDIVVARVLDAPGKNIAILKNNGFQNGEIHFSTTYRHAGSVGSSALSVSLVDMDLDGDLDLVTLAQDNGRIYTIENYTSQAVVPVIGTVERASIRQ